MPSGGAQRLHSLRRVPATRFRLLSIALGLLGVAFLAVAAVSTRTAADTYPVADTATTSISTLQAARGSLSVGSYSRFGWNHPGPLLYQVLAGPYELSGRREIALKWTALALNLAWLGGLLVLVARRAPGLAMAIAAALIPLLGREQRLLFSAWNPFVTVLALAFAVAAAADLATGRGWRTRLGPTWLVIALSFCVQAHAGLVVPAAVCVLVTAFGLRRPVAPAGATATAADRVWPAIRPGVLIAAAVAATLWLMPLVAELRERPGNLAAMLTFLSDGSLPRRTWLQAIPGAAYMTIGPYLPFWVLHFNEVPSTLPGWLPGVFGLLIGATAACAIHLHRRGRSYEAAVGVIAGAVSVAVVISAKGIVGPFSDYLLVWATGIGALDIAVVVATLVALLPNVACVPLPGDARGEAFVRGGGLAVAALAAWAVIGGLRLTGKHDEQARDTTLRALSTDLQAYCDRAGISRPLLAFGGDEAWRETAGVVLQFDKADRPIAVEDRALFLVGRAFARTGREDAAFLLMPTAGVPLPADAGPTAWITTRGAFRIVRLRVR